MINSVQIIQWGVNVKDLRNNKGKTLSEALLKATNELLPDVNIVKGQDLYHILLDNCQDDIAKDTLKRIYIYDFN
jgi:hypothetical protein